jgi:hypothetical protein
MAERRRLRLVLAFDSEAEGDETLDLGCALAAALRVQMEGVFVEEESLLEAAAVPVTSLVDHTGVVRGIDAASLARSYRSAARQTERRLASRARAAQLSWTFRSARARLLEELRAACARHDMVVVGRAAHAPRRRLQGGTVLAVVGAGTSSERVVEFVRRLPERTSGRVVVLLTPGASEAAQHQAGELRSARSDVALVAVDVMDVGRVVAAQRAEGAALVVLGADEVWLAERTLRRLRGTHGSALVIV